MSGRNQGKPPASQVANQKSNRLLSFVGGGCADVSNEVFLQHDPLQLRLPLLMIGHHSVEQAPERCPVVLVFQMTELVNEHVIYALPRCADQVAAQYEIAARGQTAPAVGEIADDQLRASMTEFSEWLEHGFETLAEHLPCLREIPIGEQGLSFFETAVVLSHVATRA